MQHVLDYTSAQKVSGRHLTSLLQAQRHADFDKGFQAVTIRPAHRARTFLFLGMDVLEHQSLQGACLANLTYDLASAVLKDSTVVVV